MLGREHQFEITGAPKVHPKRRAALQDLLWLRGRSAQLSTELATFERKHEDPRVILEAVMLQTLLVRFMKGYISAQEIADWANLVEYREDLEYEAAYSEQIDTIVQALANSEINNPIDKDLCTEFLTWLENKCLKANVDEIAIKSEIIRLCILVKSEQIDLVHACRTIVLLGNQLQSSNLELLLPFKGVASEYDTYPTSTSNHLFSRDYVENSTIEMKVYIEEVRTSVLEACDTVINEYSRSQY